MPEDKLQNCLLFLENMSLGGIGACGDTKYQNFDSIFEETKIPRKGKVFGKPICFDVKVYFSELKAYFVIPVPRRLISILD